MDQPVYVIKSVESVWTYKYNGKIYDVLKKVVWILVILFIISSLFFIKIHLWNWRSGPVCY